MRISITLLAVASLALPAPAMAEAGGPGFIPQLVLIYTDSSLCSGTIVAPNVVLTAAHCISGPLSAYDIGTGPTGNLCEWPNGNARPCSDPYLHALAVAIDPGYVGAADDYQHDAAVIELNRPTGIAPMPLAAPVDGSSGISYGWGLPTGGGAPTMSPATVDFAAPVWHGPMQFDADGPGLRPGDSGGPLVVNGAEVGINDQGGPGYSASVYTRADAVEPFVAAEIAAWPRVLMHRRQLRQLGRSLARWHR